MRDPRSAFRPKIFEPHGAEFYWVGIERTSALARMFGVAPKRYQSVDSYMMYFRDAETVAAALKETNRAAPAWRIFIESVVKSPNYVKLNQLTRGSMELSVAAAVKMLTALGPMRQRLEELNEAMRQLAEGKVPPGMEAEAAAAGGPQKLLSKLEGEAMSCGVSVANKLEAIAKELKQYAEARREAEAAAVVLSGGRGYSLEGLSLWHFLTEPDAFRQRVKLLRDAARMFRRFMSAFNEQPAEQRASLWGGIVGATLMTRYEQVVDAVPHELAVADELPELFAAKVATKQVTIRERGTRLKLLVYVDKSGSMAGQMADGTPKISAAAALALALHRRYNADVFLFDTEVDRVSPREVVETLTRIWADGGTNIARVMEDAMERASGNTVCIIISDGISEVPQGLASKFIERCGRRARVILIPPAGEGFRWVQELKKLGAVHYAKDIAQFEKAAAQALSK
jgi:uncharacterized protein with von Willebrand factor type A (vWA) domain